MLREKDLLFGAFDSCSQVKIVGLLELLAGLDGFGQSARQEMGDKMRIRYLLVELRLLGSGLLRGQAHAQALRSWGFAAPCT